MATIQQLNPQSIVPTKQYKNVIFDLGGVLVYWNPKELITRLFEHEAQIPWEYLEVTKSTIWSEIDRGTISYEQAVQQFSQQYPQPTFQQYLNAIQGSLGPMHEGVEILRHVQAQGYKTYILSNLGEWSYTTLSKVENFFSSFDGAVFSYQIKKLKPEPEIYQHLLQTYKLNPDESIFIDDLEANIEGAKQQGIDGIVCTNHTYVVEELKKRNILP